MRIGGRIFGQDVKADDEILEALPYEYAALFTAVNCLSLLCRRNWRLPPRGTAWKDWDTSAQLPMFEPLPPDLKPHVPPAWAPESRRLVVIESAIAYIDKAFSPVAKVVVARSDDDTQARAEARHAFAISQRQFVNKHQLRCKDLEDLIAKVS